MKTSSLKVVLLAAALGCGLFRPTPADAQPGVDSYTNTVPSGLTLIANQLDRGANRLDEVLPHVPDGSRLYKWETATQTFRNDMYDGLAGGWIDAGSGVPSTTTLGAYEAAVLLNPGAAYELVFTGTPRSPVPPPPALSRNVFHYLSGPTKQRATFTDITGLAPENGALLLRSIAPMQAYQTNRFTGGAWELGEPVAEVGEGVIIWLPPAPPMITFQPQSLNVTPGSPATFSVTALGEPLTYRWLFNGKVIKDGTNDTLTITNIHSRDAGPYAVEVSNAAGTVMSSNAWLTVSFPSSVLVSLNPDGMLSVVGTDGNERIHVRHHPSDPTQVQVVQVDSSGAPSDVQLFPLAAIHGVDVDLGPGNNQLVIGIVFAPDWVVNLDNGAGAGMLIADERGLAVPKRPDGIVNFLQLSNAFAPVLNLGPAQSSLLAQAAMIREQGSNLILGGLDLAHLANSNLVKVTVALGQQATNQLFSEALAVQNEALRLIGVASNYLALAQTFWPPPAELFLDPTSLDDAVTAMEAEADVYLDQPGPLSPADQAALDTILAAIDGQLAAYDTNAAAFQQRIETEYAAPSRALEAAVAQQVRAPGELLAQVTVAAVEAHLEQFAGQADALLAEAEVNFQSRADLLNAASDALQLAANALESNAIMMEQSLDAFFANVPASPPGKFAPASGITGVNCQPSTVFTLSGAGLLIGTPLSDLLILTGSGFVAGLGDNDRINGSPTTDFLMGNAGDDAIYGDGATDFILGGPGNDCLKGEDGIDFILGGIGDDEITGGNDADFLFGLAGNDIIEGNASYDLVMGGNGDDMIFGGDDIDILLGDGINATGDDYIEGNGGTSVTILGQTYIIGNLIVGQMGNDTCLGGNGIDAIFGNDGIDTLNGDDNIDFIVGNDGDDTIDGGSGGVLIVINGVPVRFGNLMFGLDGVDTITAGGDLDLAFGNNDNDTLSGANGTHALMPIVNDLYFGGPGADTILGSRVGADWIFGGADADDAEGDDGNILAAPFFDFVFGNGGPDTLRGGHGMDLVVGGDGDDMIQGGDGLIDFLAGMNGADQINGNDGSDFIIGGPGNDTINGDDGPLDACFGGADDDIVNGNGGISDFVSGDGGDDLVDGGPGVLDLCFGMIGNDVVNGGDGPDFVFGNDGDDMCNGNDGLFDIVSGDDGNDIVHGNAGVDFCFGGVGQDCVFGDADPDICSGGDDDDLVEGGSSFDFLWGDDGNDELHGGTGADVLIGGPGNDELYGEDGWDALFGNDGDDKLIGGQGADLLVGGNGGDLLLGDAGVDVLNGDELFCGGTGNDFIYGGPDRDFAYGGNGDDVILGEGGRDWLWGDCLFGGNGNDCLDGGDAKDWIFCGDGNDRAWGRDAGDRIFGGSGDDQLDGGPGNDYVNGGTGSDDLYGGSGVNVLLNGTVQTGNLAGGCPDPACSQICGRKFKDLNANGALDGGEPWLLGVTIYLDLNCNGILDAGEPSMVTGPDNPATIKVDESGYCFKGLLPGTYCVREIVPPGSTQSFPANGAPHVVGLGVFSKAGGIDFGNKMCTNTQPLNLLAIIARCGMNKIILSFSAPLDPATASNPANYSVAPLQTILSATLVNPQTVCLITSTPFVAGSFYELEICNVKDRCGNPLVTKNHPVAGCVLASFQCANSKLIYTVPDGNGGLNIIWDPTEDILECSTDLLNWTVVPNATSPYNVIPNNGMKFYRVRKI